VISFVKLAISRNHSEKRGNELQRHPVECVDIPPVIPVNNPPQAVIGQVYIQILSFGQHSCKAVIEPVDAFIYVSQTAQMFLPPFCRKCFLEKNYLFFTLIKTFSIFAASNF
jgi:hypothetical protein